jgi:hypothetical protein
MHPRVAGTEITSQAPANFSDTNFGWDSPPLNMRRIIRNTLLPALAVVVVTGTAAQGGLPYLPQVGPPPLRILASKNPAAADVIKLMTTQTAASNTLARIEAQAIAMPTNSASIGLTNAISSSPFGLGTPENPLSDSRTATIFALPTPDLLGITPQMLVNYFHPVTSGAGTNIFIGPYPTGFTPPLTAPDKSSRAEYIIK